MNKIKQFSSLILAFFLFGFANSSTVYAGTGTIRAEVLEMKNGISIPSYVDSASVIGPTPSRGIGSVLSCEDKDYTGGHCYYVVKSGNQIKVIGVRSIIEGVYTITGSRKDYKDSVASFTVTSTNENSQVDGELTIAANDEQGIPRVLDPGTVARGSSATFRVGSFTDSMFLGGRYALELADQFGNRFDCQKIRRESSNLGTATLRTPSDSDISGIVLRVYRANTNNTTPPVCDDIQGQSPLDSINATLSQAPGGAEVLYKYDKDTNACNPSTDGESLEDCEKRIVKNQKRFNALGPIGCDAVSGQGISTALGCIPVRDTNAFVGWFLKWALGIAGGVAFILMIMAAFQIMTGGGNPDKVQGGRELLNAAISGLVLIIFSIFLLKLIGVDILGLPGFGP